MNPFSRAFCVEGNVGLRCHEIPRFLLFSPLRKLQAVTEQHGGIQRASDLIQHRDRLQLRPRCTRRMRECLKLLGAGNSCKPSAIVKWRAHVEISNKSRLGLGSFHQGRTLPWGNAIHPSQCSPLQSFLQHVVPNWWMVWRTPVSCCNDFSVSVHSWWLPTRTWLASFPDYEVHGAAITTMGEGG